MTTTIRKETKKIAWLLADMVEKVMNNHCLASSAIKKSNKEMALEVLEKDKIVDADFLSIQAEIEFMIAKAPTDKDLRRILAFLHIIINIERIGDYAKRVAKFIMKSDKISSSSIQRITKPQDKFIITLKAIPNIIIEEDVDLAKEIWNTTTKIYDIIHKIRKKVITSISVKSNKKAIEERLLVLNIVNSFERACGHIASICEMIQYIKTGQHLNLGD